jgi:hypothetical protein
VSAPARIPQPAQTTQPARLTPLRPHEFFAVPWSGEGEWIASPWLRRVARRPRRFSFSTSTTWLSEDVWIVHDTLTWEDGGTEHRAGVARLAAEDRISLSYEDMLGGTDLHLRADGFTFSPYQIMVAMPPLPFPIVIAARDRCEWRAASEELIDTIELRLFGVPVGRMVMRLRPITRTPAAI